VPPPQPRLLLPRAKSDPDSIYPMKKWLYLVLPVVMAGVFLIFFFQHEKERDVREATNKAKAEAKASAEKAVKDAAEAKAKESALLAQQERDRENAAREAARKAQQDAVDKDIKDKTDASLLEIDTNTRKSKQLETEIERLVAERERVTREAFELAKQVELATVARRNAEMEEQRLTEMIARRTGESFLPRLPPPPPPPSKG
jgi:preprotein translocase subunit SecF